MKKNLKVLCGLALLGSVVGTTVGCGPRENPSSSSSGESTSSQDSSSTSSSSSEVKKMLEKLIVDASYAKTKFNKGEDFSTDGLELRVGYSDESDGIIYYEKLPLTSEGVSIDSSSYNKDAVGSYTISVSYTYDKAIRYGEYVVEVVDEYDGQLGIDVAISSTDATLALTSENKTADLTSLASKLTVKEVLADGTLSSAMEQDKYEVSYYSGDTKLDDATAINEAGVYQIWVKTTLTRDSKTFDVSNFVFVYVTNELVSITLKTDVGTFTQESGKDVISSTWEFVAHYANEATKELTAEDVTIDIDTKTAGTSKKATVTYEETDPLGEKASKSVEVPYTITASKEATTTYVYRFDPATIDKAVDTNFSDDLTLATVDKDGVSTDTVMTFIAGSKNYKMKASEKSITLTDGTSFTTSKAIQVGGASSGITSRVFKFTAQGASTIDLYFTSTGADKTVAASLLDNAGTVISSTDKIGNTLTKVTFSVENAGTYYISFDNNANVYYIDITSTVTNKQARAPESYNISEYTPAFTAGAAVNNVTFGEFITFVGAVAKDKDASPYSKAWQLTNKLSESNNVTLDFSTLDEGENATVKVKFASGSSTLDARALGFFKANVLSDANLITAVTVAETTTTKADKNIMTLEYTFTKGTYYIGSFIYNADGTTINTGSNKGINIFAISVDYE